ncbi:MAG: response regulator [Acidobacteria bacterium]|nr:response regulator [Acidobacteriota bacterium]
MATIFCETSQAITPYSVPLPDLEDGERSILIVDDEASIRDLFACYLGDRYVCVTACDAPEALAHLARQPFALVISDVHMPGLSGIELLRKITEQFPDTAVVMISGVDRMQRVMDALRLGAYDYLVKPCELDVLGHGVERALERRALLLNARRYKQELEQHNQELARRKAELERLQAQIVHSEKMASLGQLAAGIAHELNNPAGFIYGNMELLSERVTELERFLKASECPPPSLSQTFELRGAEEAIDYQEAVADLRSIITDCQDGAERIRDVVQNLRLFSRLDEAEFKQVELHEGIESTLRLLSRYYSSNRITLLRDYADLPRVSCYAGQLNQVWMNLLVNAAQAIGSDCGVVTITTRLEDESVRVSINDTGSGIEPAHLDKIFDPFFTTKPIGEGTGLGLSIIYGIIERHNGSIQVASCKDSGTTFTVTLPVAPNN